MEVKFNDLPDLVLEKILSYLSLKYLIRSRAVSRRWHLVISGIKVKHLCLLQEAIDCYEGKGRILCGPFKQNYIKSNRFSSFFRTFGQSILSRLKHLRLFAISLNKKNSKRFTPTLNSLD